jgi:hypothetical protein
MATCNELYRRTPAGLAPEIAFFAPRDGGDALPGRHAGDAGGGDFTVKPQARARAPPPRGRPAPRRGALLRRPAGQPGPSSPQQRVWHSRPCSAPCHSPSSQRSLGSATSQQCPNRFTPSFVRVCANASRRDSESARWRQDAHNLLRPEAVESLFVLWRVTGDARYREWGWHMFRAWHRFCRVPTGGFANLESVLTVRARACRGRFLDPYLTEDGRAERCIDPSLGGWPRLMAPRRLQAPPQRRGKA